MKTHLMMCIVALTAASCSREVQPVATESPTVNLNNAKQGYTRYLDLNKLSSKTSIKATLQTTSGQRIDRASQLTPNTTYQIVLESPAKIDFYLRSYDGFTLVSSAADVKIGSDHTVVTYSVKTGAKPESMYISLLPLRVIRGVQSREPVQTFLLAEQVYID